MGQYYQDLDRDHFDYDLHPVQGISGQLFRGHPPDRDQPYIACVGAAQTFGRYCNQPFPALLGDSLGVPVLNLGSGGAGPRALDKPEYLEWLNGAELVVAQVLAGRSEGNSLFANLAGTHIGVRIDTGREMRFEHFLRELVDEGPPERVRRIVRETRDNFVRHFIDFIRHIHRPTLLLWLSTRSPDYEDDYSSSSRLMNRFPQLVNRSMLEQIRAHSDAYVECISGVGLPQRLWEAEQTIDGAVLKDGVLINRYYPSPEMHAEAAEKLTPVCRRFLATRSDADRPLSLSDEPRSEETPICFAIVCADRTGSTLLRGMLNSHPDVYVGGELFNDYIPDGRIPWQLDSAPTGQDAKDELTALRRADPVAFLERLFGMSAQRGYRVIGFKLMYYHGDRYSAVRDRLRDDTAFRIIHLKRRNLLRRYISEQRARMTGEWSHPSGVDEIQLPEVPLKLKDCLQDFDYVEQQQREYADLFERHDVLEVFYEDLAATPVPVAKRTAAFLGLPTDDWEPRIKYGKTGTDSLRNAISGYHELRARIRKWGSFFED